MDARLIAQADRAASWLQRRHGVNLLGLRLVSGAASIATTLVALAGVWQAGHIGAGWVRTWAALATPRLAQRQAQLHRRGDYPVSVRSALALNAQVLRVREAVVARACRLLLLGETLLLLPLEVAKFAAHADLAHAVGLAVMPLMTADVYLVCCRFLGPGENGRDKQRKSVAVSQAAGA